MPFARIITHSVADARPLAEQLQARGFEVQMVCGEEMPFDPADLEINLKECSAQEALQRAAQIAGPRQISLFATSANIARPTTAVGASASSFSSATTRGSVALSPTMVIPEPALSLVETEPSTTKLPEPVTDRAITPQRVPRTVPSEQKAIRTVRVMATAATRLKLRAPKIFRQQNARKIFSDENLFWKIAALAGSTAIVLLALVALFHRFSPLPAALEPVPVTPQLAPVHHTVHTTEPNVSSEKPVVFKDAPDAPTATQSVTAVEPPSKSSDTHARHISSGADADYVAKDSVTHYASPPTPLARIERKPPSVKYYSDGK